MANYSGLLKMALVEREKAIAANIDQRFLSLIDYKLDRAIFCRADIEGYQRARGELLGVMDVLRAFNDDSFSARENNYLDVELQKGTSE